MPLFVNSWLMLCLFQREACTVCDGFYGPNFGQPVCSTCHMFLFPQDINLPEDAPYSEVQEWGLLTHWSQGNLNTILNMQFSIFVLLIGIFTYSHDNPLRWMPRDLTDDKSTLVEVMAWCHQATSHYPNQCWRSSMLPYGITRANELTYWAQEKMVRQHCQMYFLERKCIFSFQSKFL